MPPIINHFIGDTHIEKLLEKLDMVMCTHTNYMHTYISLLEILHYNSCPMNLMSDDV